MSQLSTLALLMMVAPQVSADKQSKRGYKAGLAHSASRKERMQQMRPQLHEMLLKRRTFVEMARQIGTTEMTVCRYVKADPGLNQIAVTYIKRGNPEFREGGRYNRKKKVAKEVWGR